MAWTYSGNPGHSATDAVRFLIGDTDSLEPLLLDGEIDWLLSQYGGTNNAAIRACEMITAKFARLADEQVGRVSIKYSQKAEAYRKLKADLIDRLSTDDVMPYAGGISLGDKANVESNPDRTQPAFTKHMMENHEHGGTVSPEDRTLLRSLIDD